MGDTLLGWVLNPMPVVLIRSSEDAGMLPHGRKMTMRRQKQNLSDRAGTQKRPRRASNHQKLGNMHGNKYAISESSEETNSANIWISDFQPLEL